jgi:hypothetical protein
MHFSKSEGAFDSFLPEFVMRRTDRAAEVENGLIPIATLSASPREMQESVEVELAGRKYCKQKPALAAG